MEGDCCLCDRALQKLWKGRALAATISTKPAALLLTTEKSQALEEDLFTSLWISLFCLALTQAILGIWETFKSLAFKWIKVDHTDLWEKILGHFWNSSPISAAFIALGHPCHWHWVMQWKKPRSEVRTFSPNLTAGWPGTATPLLWGPVEGSGWTGIWSGTFYFLRKAVLFR